MAAAKREYITVFSIGAKLLGSFKGAMASAQARLKALQSTAASVGKSIAKFGALFSALFAGVAAFGIGAVFKKMFEGADEAAEAAEQRTRKLTAALMTQNAIRVKGRAYAEEQVGELKKFTEMQAKAGIYGKAMLETAEGTLALQKFGPREIAKTVPLLADVLAATKGVRATQEDMNQLALGFAKAVRTGTVPRSMAQYIGALTVGEKKLLQQYTKVGDLRGAYEFLMARIRRFAGENARALNTPMGRIKAFENQLELTREHIGEQSLKSRAAMADAWRGLLPAIEPFIIEAKKMTNNMMASIANYIRVKGVPALKALSDWAHGPGAKAFERVRKAFVDMAGKLGNALVKQFTGLAGKGKSFGDIVVAAMDKLVAFFQWIGDNADTVIRVVESVTAAFIALKVASIIQGNITVLGVAAALVAITKVSSEYKKFQDLMAKKPVSDPEHFTKHWYLLNQSWTELFAGLKGIWDLPLQWHDQWIKAFTGFDWTFGFAEKWRVAVEQWKNLVEGVKGLWESIVHPSTWFTGGAPAPVPVPVTAAPPPVAAPPAPGEAMLPTPIRGFAAGGIVTRPTIAGIGERGPEAVIPLAKFTEIIDAHKATAKEQHVAAVKTTVAAVATHRAAEQLNNVTGLLTKVVEFFQTALTGYGGFGGPLGGGFMGGGGGFGGAGAGAVGGGYGGIAGQIAGAIAGPMGLGAAGAAATGGGIPVTVASYGGPAEPGQKIGAYNNRLMAGDVAISPDLYSRLGAPGPSTFINLDGQRYHVADSSWYTPGRPTSNMVEIWGYGNQIKRRGIASALAAGGLVRKPTLSLIGERGPEAVVPLHKAGGIGHTTVHFAPNITINGPATTEQQAALDRKLRELSRDFLAEFKATQNNERRLSYEGGYS